jgi:hypothetical protein
MSCRARHLALLVTLAPLLTACGDDAGLGPVTVRRPAAVIFFGDSAAVTAPDSARVVS